MVNVLFIGGASGVARSFLPPLIASPNVNITILSRLNSTSSLANLPSSIKKVNADLTDLPTLISAFEGIDVIVSTISFAVLHHEALYLEAAIAAGVKRFIASGYGVDPAHPSIQTKKDHPFFKPKISNQALQEKLAAEGKISYTTIVPAAFADWGFEYSFWGIDIPNRKAILIDGGDVPYSSTNLLTVGKTLAWIVNNLDASKNRKIYIQDIAASQNELLAETEKVLGGEPFEREYLTGPEAFDKGVKLATEGKLAEGVKLVLLATVCGKDGAGLNLGNDGEEIGLVPVSLERIVSGGVKFWEEKKTAK